MAPFAQRSALLQWWGEQNTHNRHLWPGLLTSSVGSRADWPASELVSQVLATRADKTASGNVHYSMQPLLKNRAGVSDALDAKVYETQALIPASTWLPGETPRAPLARYAPDGSSRVNACFGDTTLIAPRWSTLSCATQQERSSRRVSFAWQIPAMAAVFVSAGIFTRPRRMLPRRLSCRHSARVAACDTPRHFCKVTPVRGK